MRDTLQTTSLLFIPHDTAIRVVCSSGTHQASIFTENAGTPPTSSAVPNSVPTNQLDNEVKITQSGQDTGNRTTVYTKTTLNPDNTMMQTTVTYRISSRGKTHSYNY